MKYGSDLMAELIASMDIPFIALNPGASYRGLHESLVNHPEVQMPEIIECTHEEISVAIAHGYAKASGKPMASALHNLVGLQHATMAIFNAWCDRVPILLLGGTGPMAIEKRRPWIDWIHTALVQGNLIRDYVKWDDQPASLEGVADSLLRAYRLMVTEPAGPVYVCFDAGLQEEEVAEEKFAEGGPFHSLPNINAFQPGVSPAPQDEAIEEIAAAVKLAQWPVIIADLTGRSDEAFHLLAKLSQEWAIPVIDKGARFNMPTDHPMNLSYDDSRVLEQADVVIGLDVRDFFGSTSKIDRVRRETVSLLSKDARIFSISLQDYIARSWASDYQRLFPAEKQLLADSKEALKVLLKKLGSRSEQSSQAVEKIEFRYAKVQDWHQRLREQWAQKAKAEAETSPVSVPAFAEKLWEVLQTHDFILANGHLQGWVHRIFEMDEPRQYLGRSGGGGLGYGIGAAIGACLAHRDSGKLVVDIQSDGDLLFTPGGLWTLAHHNLPALIVMNNNRSYYNSEEHQTNMARIRGRDPKKAVVGTLLEDPFVDYAGLAKSMGVWGIGPIEQTKDIVPALEEAISYIKKKKKPALVDVITSKMGY